MPIRPELRHFYQGPNWGATRARILNRARNCCEQCHKPNGLYLKTRTDGKGFIAWRHPGWGWVNGKGWPLTVEDFRIAIELPVRKVRVVLTIAHLNHTPGDDRDENLKALCQYCHLTMDKPAHRITRQTRKDAARPLLVAAS